MKSYFDKIAEIERQTPAALEKGPERSERGNPLKCQCRRAPHEERAKWSDDELEGWLHVPCGRLVTCRRTDVEPEYCPGCHRDITGWSADRYKEHHRFSCSRNAGKEAYHMDPDPPSWWVQWQQRKRNA